MNYFAMYSIAFLLGGNIYCAIEILYRGWTHYSMFFCGGLVLLILFAYYVNHKNTNIFLFAFIGTITITVLEFIFGVVFNLMLNMNVWDYSNVPFNIFGQICLPFMGIWFGFSLVIYFVFTKLNLHNIIVKI